MSRRGIVTKKCECIGCGKQNLCRIFLLLLCVQSIKIRTEIMNSKIFLSKLKVSR